MLQWIYKNFHKEGKEHKMTQYTVNLSPETAHFYEMVAQSAGRSTEQVLSDALFKLAGELSLEALHKKGKRQGR